MTSIQKLFFTVASIIIATIRGTAVSATYTVDLSNGSALSNAITSGYITQDAEDSSKILFTTGVALHHSSHTGVIISFASGTKIATEDKSTLTLTGLHIGALHNAASQLSNQSDAYAGGIKFGLEDLGLIFTQPVGITVPVTNVANGQTVSFLIKHAGDDEFNTTGLTTDVNTTCTDGSPNQTGNTATVTNGAATIYTCRASSFATLHRANTVNGWDDVRFIDWADPENAKNIITQYVTSGDIVISGNQTILNHNTIIFNRNLNIGFIGISSGTVITPFSGQSFTTDNLHIASFPSENISSLGTQAQYYKRGTSFGGTGGHVMFDKPVATAIWVKDLNIATGTTLRLFTRHAADQPFTGAGISTSQNSTCSDGKPSQPDNTITYTGSEQALFYTCHASDFVLVSVPPAQPTTHTSGKTFTTSSGSTASTSSSTSNTSSSTSSTSSNNTTTSTSTASTTTSTTSTTTTNNTGTNNSSLLAPYIAMYKTQSAYTCNDDASYEDFLFEDANNDKTREALKRARLNCLIQGRSNGAKPNTRNFASTAIITHREAGIIGHRLSKGIGEDVSKEIYTLYNQLTPISREKFVYVVVNRYDSRLPRRISAKGLQLLIAIDKVITTKKLSHAAQKDMFVNLVKAYHESAVPDAPAMDLISVIGKILLPQTQAHTASSTTTTTTTTSSTGSHAAATNTTNNKAEKLYNVVAKTISK